MSWVTPPVLVGLTVSVAAMAASTFTTLGLGALAPELRSSLHLTTFEVGLIPGLVFLGALAASVPADTSQIRIGAGRSLTLAQLGLAFGIGIAVASSSRSIFLAGVAIAGTGYGAVNPATNVLSTGLVPRRRRALFLSIEADGGDSGRFDSGPCFAKGWRERSDGGRRWPWPFQCFCAARWRGCGSPAGRPPGGSRRHADRFPTPFNQPQAHPYREWRQPRCSDS